MPPDQRLEQTWAVLLDRLHGDVPDDVYRIWLEPLRPVAIAEGVLYVRAPQQTRDWVRRRFGALMSNRLASLERSLRRVELVTEAEPAGRATPAPARHAGGLKPRHRFDEFVIGAGNRFAHAASLAVAELPGQAYNPLFLYGPAGVGKTHLMNAIGNYTTANDTALEVLYATAERFTGDFTSAVRANAIEAFKATYRHVDLLLFDDVQFVESKPRTADELLHTFDALAARGAQIVLGADRPPSAMPALDSRLRDRFESGLMVDLQPPDFETRLSILRKRSGRLLGAEEQPAALELLARRVSSSVHALEGALIRVRAYASLTQQPLTTALVEHVLASLYTPSTPRGQNGGRVTIERIQEVTSTVLELPIPDLSSAKRRRQVVYARQVAMYLCRELTDLSLPAIGQRFGGRDHTTVLHAHRQIRARLLTDGSTRELVDGILDRLGAHTGQA